MLRGSATLISLSVLVITIGCEKKVSVPPQSSVQVSACRMEVVAVSQRFVAVHHKLEIIAPESDLAKAWEAVITFCGKIQCEIVSSSITKRTRDLAPSASVSLRVTPEDLKKLLDYVEKQGNIVEHTTESADKTATVVDTDAKIKNFTSFRGSLRMMLTRPSVSVKDLVEIQRQLTDVQSQLDSETAQRKILANETEKVAVEMSFRVEKSFAGGGTFTPIWNALRNSGSILAESIASLIEFIVSVIPWLVLIVPGLWLSARFWRKLRRSRAGSVPVAARGPGSSGQTRT